MKKLFQAILVIYIISGFLGFISLGQNDFIEQDSFHQYLKAYLLFRIIIAFVFGFLLYRFYVRVYPEKYEERKNKFWFKPLVLLVLPGLAFLINTGLLLPLNSLLGSQPIVEINGIVTGNKITAGAKTRSYNIIVTDSSGYDYPLEVRSSIYYKYPKFSSFRKEFSVGRLGIIYRKQD